ncbi:hypothetical protein ROZALSC1DRAFT_30661 [Rozella allomycis CSF55]|uniref:BHLH domain-containing protein n=1 Tax=Rozella allomycis (strain CSF55) TaxID=988480 RepID=A0A075B4H1_ROZAC|nr:hypothetical protein O9G_004011 [Rozella allomycis CSF55]RKP17546.1 hypothetical protein ROZALSC1DRAFT_30661 [Rozella allomycis CSF55]|eukprot:EPZ36352.1 hypothetical protein O9G_004011 [Rozella allomycis CSF55]
MDNFLDDYTCEDLDLGLFNNNYIADIFIEPSEKSIKKQKRLEKQKSLAPDIFASSAFELDTDIKNSKPMSNLNNSFNNFEHVDLSQSPFQMNYESLIAGISRPSSVLSTVSSTNSAFGNPIKERRRRADERDAFHMLDSVLPPDQPGRRMTKAKKLLKSVEYIKYLQKRHLALTKELEYLRSAHPNKF